MTPLVGPYLAACALLAGGGALKAAKPADTATALRAAGLPGSVGLVRAVGVAEAVLAVAAGSTGEPALAALVAVSYLAFAEFVIMALVRHLPISTCGCLGSLETPPTALHAALNLAAAAVAGGVALSPPGSLAEIVGAQPLAGVPFVILVGAVTFLAALVMSELPRARSLRVRRTP